MNVLDYATQCKLALQGAAFRWQDTPIEVTPAAKATDPFRGLRGEWWKKSEPRDASGREIIRLTDGRTLRIVDNAEEENQFVRQKDKPTSDDELAPNETESIADWFGRLGKSRNFNTTYRKLLFDALRSYASRFRGDLSAKKLLDNKLVRKFLEQTA